MATGSKLAPESAARIEIAGFAGIVPAYGGSVEQLPACFWETFARSLNEAPAETPLPPADWLMVEAASSFAYHSAADIVSSTLWADFITPRDAGWAETNDVLHAAFATLSGLGLDGCCIADLVPHERLVLHVERYDGLVAIDKGASPRAARLVVCGLCAGIMDLAYGTPGGPAGRRRTFECRQTLWAGRPDGFDEFVTRRL